MVKKILIGLLLFVLFILADGYTYYRLVIYQPTLISDEDRHAVTIMPLPSSLELSGGEYLLSESIGVSIQGHTNSRLDRAIDHFISQISIATNLELLKKTGIGLVIQCKGEGNTIPTGDDDES